jgi:hypothetical protein
VMKRKRREVSGVIRKIIDDNGSMIELPELHFHSERLTLDSQQISNENVNGVSADNGSDSTENGNSNNIEEPEVNNNNKVKECANGDNEPPKDTISRFSIFDSGDDVPMININDDQKATMKEEEEKNVSNLQQISTEALEKDRDDHKIIEKKEKNDLNEMEIDASEKSHEEVNEEATEDSMLKKNNSDIVMQEHHEDTNTEEEEPKSDFNLSVIEISQDITQVVEKVVDEVAPEATEISNSEKNGGDLHFKR